ncbi:MAG: hypothetical protein H7269_15705 [Cellulomonas sp.]|nr:hypothetical protein [Cellulomonas sp.]
MVERRGAQRDVAGQRPAPAPDANRAQDVPVTQGAADTQGWGGEEVAAALGTSRCAGRELVDTARLLASPVRPRPPRTGQPPRHRQIHLLTTDPNTPGSSTWTTRAADEIPVPPVGPRPDGGA